MKNRVVTISREFGSGSRTICLDSGRLGIDTCVKILRQLY